MEKNGGIDESEKTLLAVLILDHFVTIYFFCYFFVIEMMVSIAGDTNVVMIGDTSHCMNIYGTFYNIYSINTIYSIIYMALIYCIKCIIYVI